MTHRDSHPIYSRMEIGYGFGSGNLKSEMRRFRWGLAFRIFASMLATAALFQNCTSRSADPNSKTDSSSSSPAPTQLGGNGSGYDGKVYVHLREDGVCPDNSLVDSQIQIRNDKAYLTRHDCAEIPVAAQVEVTVTYVAAEPGTLLYNSKKYIALLITVEDQTRDAAGDIHIVGFASPLEQRPNGTIMNHYAAYGFIAKIDSQARATSTLSAAKQIFQSIKSLPDGNLLAFGNYNMFEPDSELMLMKISPAHQILWRKHFVNQPGYVGSTAGWEMTFDGTGNIYLALSTSLADGRHGITILKLSGSGDVVWQKSLTGVVVDAPTYLMTSPQKLLINGSHLFVAGYVNGEASVSRLNTVDGSTDWTRNFPQFRYYINRTPPVTLTMTDAGTALFTAGAPFGNGRLIQLGQMGEILSAQYFAMATGDFEIRGITSLGAGRYCAAGSLTHVLPQTTRGAVVTFSLQNVQWASQFIRGRQSSFTVAPSVGNDGIIRLFGHTDLGIPNASTYVTASVIRYTPAGAAPACPYCSAVSATLVDDTSLQVGAGPLFTDANQIVASPPKPITFGTIPVPLFLF